MALSAVLIDALHSALEYAEIALFRIRVSLAADVLFLAVVHGLVVRELLADVQLPSSVIKRFLGNVLPQDQLDRCRL